jgi:protein phosphatase
MILEKDMIGLVETSSFSFPKKQDRINQDSILVPRKLKDGYLIAVADGLGSYAGGEIASRLAIQHLENATSKEQLINKDQLFEDIKKDIVNISLSDEKYSKAATTLTFAYIDSEGLRVSHIGDCRVYIREDNSLSQLTKDHTQFQKLIDEKVFTKKYLADTKAKSVLTTAIAPNVQMKVDSFFIPLELLPKFNNKISIYIMSDGAHHFWEKRPRFCENTMNCMSQFFNSFKRRIEKSSPIDDYSAAGISVDTSRM